MSLLFFVFGFKLLLFPPSQNFLSLTTISLNCIINIVAITLEPLVLFSFIFWWFIFLLKIITPDFLPIDFKIHPGDTSNTLASYFLGLLSFNNLLHLTLTRVSGISWNLTLTIISILYNSCSLPSPFTFPDFIHYFNYHSTWPELPIHWYFLIFIS